MKNKGITLITLIITIVLLIILAGVTINLSLGKNGILGRAKQAQAEYNETSERERLQNILLDIIVQKQGNNNLNTRETLEQILEKNKMKIDEDIVTVEEYNFQIDENKLEIIQDLGKTKIKIKNELQEYLGKNEDDKYIAKSLIVIESNTEIESVILPNENGTEMIVTVNDKKIEKYINIELGKKYHIKVKTKDGKNYVRDIVESEILRINNINKYIGTAHIDFQIDKTQISGVKLKYNYIYEEVKTGLKKETGEIEINPYSIDELQPETEYKVILQITDESGYYSKTEEFNIKTEPRTYLYNYGDMCYSITGGWSRAWMDTSDVKWNSNHINWSTSYQKPGVGYRTTNKINLSEYSRLYINYQGSINGSQNIGKLGSFGYSTDIISQWNFPTKSNFIGQHIPNNYYNGIKRQNISISNSGYIYFEFYGCTNMQIYNIWLEK